MLNNALDYEAIKIMIRHLTLTVGRITYVLPAPQPATILWGQDIFATGIIWQYKGKN